MSLPKVRPDTEETAAALKTTRLSKFLRLRTFITLCILALVINHMLMIARFHTAQSVEGATTSTTSDAPLLNKEAVVVDETTFGIVNKNTTIPWHDTKLSHCKNATSASNKVYRLPTQPTSQSDHTEGVLRIPPNIIINSKHGLHMEPAFIQANVRQNLHHFPNWTLIADDDTTCLGKIKQIDVYNTLEMETWYTSKETQGMYKSDVCRMSQLYLDGGFYFDNDLEVTSSALLDDSIAGGIDVVSVISLNKKDIFQAILAAPPRHPLIRKAMDISVDVLFKDKEFNYQYLGTGVLHEAIKTYYNESAPLNAKNLLCKGVYLLRETYLQNNRPELGNRQRSGGCNVAVVDDKQQVYAFSRVKVWGTADNVCHVTEQ
ncbi:predicted protein [Thalassiosira pseudonana CCMP1335]|uniref:Uncharacterized protein n=1 Tax=Thalassiosira pseudonana TaxID=35128 RepID=B8LBM4_THAPS|nr:predicted protein [Thalassiosira pseudonana CCMP1335]EED87208.1 predicted protein [Thalassiosira pseudonana CCMP1335]